MKKVIALVVDTRLTNDQLEECYVEVICRDRKGEDEGLVLFARNVRVLDSDETHMSKAGAVGAIREALGLMNCMIESGESHSDLSRATLAAAVAALTRVT